MSEDGVISTFTKVYFVTVGADELVSKLSVFLLSVLKLKLDFCSLLNCDILC